MFEKMKEKREQKIREEQARIAEEMRVEKERLTSLSEKELMVEIAFELKKINHNGKGIIMECEELKQTIRLYGN